MPIRTFAQFEKGSAIFYGGEEIRGQFVTTTSEKLSVNSIYILLEGEANVMPYENASSPMEHGTQCYLSERLDYSNAIELSPGTYNYAFNFTAPLTCPSSCVSPCGRIFYHVVLVIDRSWYSDHIYKEAIRVIQPNNLNLLQEAKIPIESEHIKSLCCWPFSSGPANLTLTIPFGGYVPGQKVSCTVCIDNQSVGNDLQNVQLCLKQIMSYASTLSMSNPRVREKSLVSCVLTECVKRLSKRLIRATLVVPPVPPTTLETIETIEHIIKVRYAIGISMQYGFCLNWNIDTPIIIGTEPLIQSIQNPTEGCTATAPIAETD
ncbi:arrestin domain-containing protein 3-like isoform X1 [Drosophila sulfurigaster albostrigata]|uniref:arrestin domain-containing protein 3-like isoform X1 n=1 Tax=Drosophila sulfurigaster albostrigata TaxID=89887 RepID=UPI002D21D141|nr:arrestin domain-containing protein 3-like isoform X1 [Drosophila sulfurigaster albostrigata]